MKYNSYRLHNIGDDDYEELLKSQDYRCAICFVHVDDAHKDKRRLFVDHDHDCCPGQRSCGKCIRGLLCANCNMAIGHFKDKVGLLLSAIRYLETAILYELEDSLEVLELSYQM